MSSYYEKILATGEVKCIDEEIPFEIPQGWEWCRIASLADVVRGGSPRPAGSPIFYDGSIPFLKVADLTRESSIYVKSFSSTIKEAGLSKTRLVEAGTLLLTNSGATLGVPKICTFETTFNDGVAAFLSLDERLKLYVYWFFCYMTDLYRNINQGTAQPNLNTDIIKMTLVPIPPYKEQIRIVEELGNISPIIKHYEKAQDELDELNESIPKLIKQSILQEAIRGKLVPQLTEEGTSQELLEQIKAEKQKLVKEGKLKKSALNDSVIFRGDDNKYYEQIGGEVTEIELPLDFPSSWSLARLNAVCQLTDGLKTTGKQCLLDAKYLRGKSSGTIVEQGKLVYKGDNIVLVDGENSGEVFIVPQDGYMGSTFKQLWISSSMYEPYILAFIQFYKETLRNSKKGAAIPHLNKELFYGLIIGIPPLQEQRRIVQKIEQLTQLLK
jgi:type I restriction enzyme, S subunit